MKQYFHLDAGRKFFGVPALKSILDTMAESGYDFFQLYLTDNQGCRFALEDMTLTTAYGSYDLTPCLGDGYCEGPKGPSGCGKYHTVADMDEILSYAKEKGISVIPVINMPGHMGCILEQFPHLRYRNSRSSVNMMDPEAEAFALGILEKYADYFASRGCTHMSFGADEFANDIAPGYPDDIEMGFEKIWQDGTMGHFVRFFNAAAKIILDRNMTPLAFHDGVYYRNDTSYGEMDNRVQLCYWLDGWDTYVTARADFLWQQGFAMINSPQRIYCGMGCRDWQERADNAAAFDPYIFEKNVLIEDPHGAMMCFWSDRAFLDGQDDGVKAAENVAPVLRAFGEAMKRYK